jgi:general secretion pathway protein A
MLRMVAAAFGVPHESGSKATLLRNLEQFLFASHRQGKRALLLVDEAQNLPASSVEELRMLSNFQSGDKPLLQSFLLGQPEFRTTLQSPALEQLRQRIIASCHLGPIEASETEAYILHRMRTVGWAGDPSFSADVFPAIYSYTGGIPRKINLLCDRLLLMGRLDEKHALTGKEVAEVIADLQQEFPTAAQQISGGSK